MKKTVSLILIFIMAFSLFTVFNMPASVALQLVGKQLPPSLQIGAVSGTLWQGQVSEVRVSNVQLNNVRWSIEAPALLLGDMQGNVRFGNARDKSDISGRGDFTVGLFDQSVWLSDASIRFSVEQAMSQVTLPLPVKAKGRVLLDIDNYQSGAPYCEALQGEIRSPGITVEGLTGWFEIGQLGGNLSCKTGDIAVLVDPDNRLGLQADAVLADNFQFRVAGNIKPDASLPKEVHDAVKFLGRPDSEGRYPVNL
ncbi:Type II secretion system protein N [Pseudoalteromonas holothuriae]|uniref:Type II secretion system protein N n=1 Tax=Pseudoalteromonas holothuriae TaxID=2963714 RepID=A0A9W4R4I4_9GAMM|nr:MULTISPECIES: type II secretion system protein N [unclassified Pseudoalteromonas]CAH9066503.1 Type II secretion system protein N [Pseudoalteromonas sp. CIP111854]CAH9067555.1 Type II secretion system protein N [Pseudoalteromonas sp. CIP111951]